MLILDTYLRTMPFGMGALYRASQGDPISHELYFPSTQNEWLATLTWQAPFVGGLISPGYLSVVPYLVAPFAPAAAVGASVAIAASSLYFVESNKAQIQFHYSRGAETPQFTGY